MLQHVEATWQPSRIVMAIRAGVAALVLLSLSTGGSYAQTFATLADLYEPIGSFPWYGSLIQGVNGNLDATAENGGAAYFGTVFGVTETDGNLYGTTSDGGSCFYCGTLFRVSIGLGQFVKTLPTFGTVGTGVTIIGPGLSGATRVTFNGTPASFNVVLPTAIQTSVRSGASSGTVQVNTPNGSLSSNLGFQVLEPAIQR